MPKIPIRTYRKENIEKFFEDITEDYGYSSTNQAMFEAARALIWKKEFKEKLIFWAMMIFAMGLVIGYLIFNVSIIQFFNQLDQWHN
jgi:phosphate/sulfate permease